MFLVATGLKRSAPGCLISRTMRSNLMSNLTIPRTAPLAMTSSVRSSPGTLLKNMALPLRGSDVPKALSNRPSTIPMLSPMQGRMSPGLFISNSRPWEPHAEHVSPSIKVPQWSHHLHVSFP